LAKSGSDDIVVPKTWSSFTCCAERQHMHKAEVFYCIFARIWVSVQESTPHSQIESFVHLTLPYSSS